MRRAFDAYFTPAQATRASYDALQIGAAWLCWLCCRREVFATKPHLGCIRCRP